MKGRKQILLGDLMMAGATMIFGAMTIFSKQILAELDVYNLVALRFLIAFAACFVVFVKRYSAMWKDRESRVRTVRHSAVIGTFLFISYLCMVLGCKYTTASNAGFMMSLVAFFTPLILLAFYHVIPSRIQIASVIITLIGVGLMCLSGDLTLNKGDLICVLSALFYAFQMLYTERFAKTDDPIVLGTLQLLFVSVYGFIFAFLLEDEFRLPVSSAGWWQLLYLAIGCGAIGFILQTSAEKFSPTSHTTLIYAAEPVFVAVFSYMMLGEQITLRQVAGMILVFIGVLITVRRAGREEDEHAGH